MKKFFVMATLLCGAAWTTATWAGNDSFHNVQVACFRSPAGTALGAADHYPSGDGTTCPDLCDKWESACKGWVKAASTCLKSEASKTASLEKSACLVAMNPAACKQGVGSDLETYLDDLIVETNTAKANCETNVAVCVMDCSN